MILPQGTSLHRYCVGIDLPEAWDPPFKNPESSKFPHGNVCTFGKDIFNGL